MNRTTLTLFGALLMATPLAAQHEHAQREKDTVESRIDTTLTIDRGGTVDLSLVSGEIIVTSWDRPQVKIVATTERGLLRLDPSISRISLTVRSVRGEMGDTRYEVTIPASARLIARSVSGDISTHGGSDVDARSVSGDVEVSGVAGHAELESISGNVHATSISKGLRAKAVSGDLRLADIRGDLEAQSVSGEVELEDVHSTYVRSESVSGNVRFAGELDPNGRYEFNSHSGDIQLKVPPMNATFSVETFSGDVKNEYQMATLTSNRYGGKKRVEFNLNGGGGARVTAESFSGDIVIKRASGSR